MKRTKNHKAPKTLELLTTADMVQLFQVTPSCLYRWRRRQILPSVKVGYSVYFIKEDIETILKHKSKLSMQRKEDLDAIPDSKK
ncbi:helix-turn-helix domain-containing protein [Leeuwenhoekiella aestuarii]|uniref:Helix-turn-helix protein n=1 Tax=Leeuwenhoekiella aestuarii TaxID=2249426 RepID=A0A4Q0NRH4_9FLAO|nr:helix-turn-helix domain-containing protein [Leeuwenhoekiella aestuarii]RXG13262.1 helix-turn-helix protein [Leeuwenhoekiella aestuarii]